jgi:hypothetical protein
MVEEKGKLITVILPQGKGAALLAALHERKVLRVSMGSARAPFFFTKRKRGRTKTVQHSLEKDILSIVAGAEEAEELFAFIHQKAQIGTRYGGFMFMGPLGRASSFDLPVDLPSESTEAPASPTEAAASAK